MRYILSVFLFFTAFTDPVTRIAKVNDLKRDAKEAMEEQQYVQAVLHYVELVDSLLVDDDNLKMNMANAAYNLSYGTQDQQLQSEAGDPGDISVDTSDVFNTNAELKFAVIAESKYLELVGSANKAIASNAYNQRGIIAYIQSEQEKQGSSKDQFFTGALDHFKNALRNNPMNESARYNYELLKKIKRERDQQENEDDLKPSEYAKMMKKMADELRQKGKFKEAMQTMMEALENDETTKAYQQYMAKLQTVAAI